MDLKIGIILRLMFFITFLSLIDDIERQKVRGNGLLVEATPLAVFNSLRKVYKIMKALDRLIDMFSPGEEDDSIERIPIIQQQFQIATIAKLDELQQTLTTSFQTTNNEIANINKAVNDAINKAINKAINNALEANVAKGIQQNAWEQDKNYVLEIQRKLNLIESSYNQDFSFSFQGITNYRDDILAKYMSLVAENNDLKNSLRDVLLATSLQQGHLFSKNVFQIAAYYLKNEKDNFQDCNKLSTQDQLFLFYSYILKTVVKGHTMIIMSYQYLKMRSHGNEAFYQKRQKDYQKYQKDAIIQITEAAKHYLQTIDTSYYKSSYACEPQTWEEGKNYIQIKNYASFNVMAGQCSRSYGDRTMLTLTNLCNKVFSRNTEWMRNMNVKYGNEYMVNPNWRNTISQCQAAWDSYLYNQCRQDKFSDVYLSVRKISLTLTYCDYNRNEVVTNARFREKYGMIFIEVQCGIFVDEKINQNSLRWDTAQRDSYTRDNPPPYYLTIDWETRSFPLIDYIIPESQFIVGLGFKKINNFISLEVVGMSFGYYSGLQSFTMGNNYPLSSSELNLENLPLVVNQTYRSYETSQPNKHFVNIVTSNGPDVGTNERYGEDHLPVVPFFDMSEFKPPTAFPLGGIGLMHKSVPGHAGFLALKFITSPQMRYIPNDYAEQLATQSVSQF